MTWNELPDVFLREYWQKRPLAESSAVARELPGLDPDEVAWLATQPDVESRLVTTERGRGNASYRVEHGPFQAERLGELPEADWTLLVQDVEKHLPAFRQYFDLVPYIPDWRIDDLMVSVAAPGGSVGPHRDNYDVFLVQGHGRRQWSLGDPETVQEDTSSEALSLLLPFEPQARIVADQGDMIYLPPRIPHWGIADTLCTTWSIGMRAPSLAELGAGADRVLGHYSPPDTDDRFYTDPDLDPTESVPGMISSDAVGRVRAQTLLDPGLTDTQMAMVLGAVVTDPKAWLMPEPADPIDPESTVHGMARIAWYESAGDRLVFVNGAVSAVTPACLQAFRDSCATRMAGPVLAALHGTAEGDDFVDWLRLNGFFDAARDAK